MTKYVDLNKQLVRLYRLNLDCEEIIKEFLMSADTIEIVRCRECKHYRDGFCYNPNTYDDEKTCGNTVPDWFCADGEIREEE